MSRADQQPELPLGEDYLEKIQLPRDSDGSILEEFREVKQHIRHRSNWTATNRDVLAILIDLYWLHDTTTNGNTPENNRE